MTTFPQPQHASRSKRFLFSCWHFYLAPSHAGDNYIVAAHPNEDIVDDYQLATDGVTLTRPDGSNMTTLQTSLRSDMLTVWRTLNVECDAMSYYNYPYSPTGPEDDPSKIVTPPSPENYLGGLVAEQLARACVVTEVYEPTVNNQPPVGHNPMGDQEQGNYLQGRDLLASWNSPDFWTVRMVMISDYGDDTLGAFNLGGNLIDVSYARIEYRVNEWNENHPTETIQLGNSIRRNILHEICHLLIDIAENYVYFDNDGNTSSDLSTVGVRSTIRRGTLNSYVTDMYHRNVYSQILVGDIQDIQFHSRAQD
jgi:hypothetical protein